LELTLAIVAALVAGFAAGWLLASRARGADERQLRESFEALAAQALRSTTDEFLKLADQKIGNVHREAATGLGERQQALDALVAPIRDTLSQVGAKLAEFDRQRMQDASNLRSALVLVGHTQQQLHQETQNLVRALRSPGVRGRWGEVQLRKVVELAGMLEHCDFVEQPSATTDAGERLRPDLVVTLPGSHSIVVDAKVPLEAFLDAQAATDDGVRSGKLADHVRQVRDHIARLGAKAYWEQFSPSPDFVVLFLPAEAIFMAALEQDAALIEFGVRQQVLIASPLTLIALLRAAALGWRQERLTLNAEEISRLGGALHESVATMAEHLDDLRKRLDGAFATFNRVVGSFESNVLVKARKLKELGAGSARDIEVVEPVEIAPRPVQGQGQPDLLEAAVDAETTTGERS
jgi:DNA recombination protein RmuC